MRGAAATLCILLAPAGAGAQRAGAREVGDDEAVPAAEKEEAKQHFREGQLQFKLGKFDRAAREFEAAYRLYPDPAFLYNLGQAYRQWGDNRKASFFFRSYLREVPDAADRDAIEELIADLEQEQERAGAEDGGDGFADESVAASAPVDDGAGEKLRTAGWITLGLGAGLVAVGTGFALAAKSRENELEDAFAEGETIYAETSGTRDQGERLSAIGVGTLVAGGLALGVGATLLVLGWSDDEDGDEEIAIAPAPGGVVLAGSF